mmetsp:Transcript_10513/g.24445  ORF Transcript_10513/g.24445 Transcript_10513/m.24445 type:complete len:226 (+) Transcript_10513:261-938(+)
MVWSYSMNPLRVETKARKGPCAFSPSLATSWATVEFGPVGNTRPKSAGFHLGARATAGSLSQAKTACRSVLSESSRSCGAASPRAHLACPPTKPNPPPPPLVSVTGRTRPLFLSRTRKSWVLMTSRSVPYESFSIGKKAPKPCLREFLESKYMASSGGITRVRPVTKAMVAAVSIAIRTLFHPPWSGSKVRYLGDPDLVLSPRHGLTYAPLLFAPPLGAGSRSSQ